jgi:hypothetical protein
VEHTTPFLIYLNSTIIFEISKQDFQAKVLRKRSIAEIIADVLSFKLIERFRSILHILFFKVKDEQHFHDINHFQIIDSLKQIYEMYYSQSAYAKENFDNEENYKMFLPNVTMDFNSSEEETFVQEIAVTSMNMCQLLQVLQSLSYVSSCLIHTCNFTLSSGHL